MKPTQRVVPRSGFCVRGICRNVEPFLNRETGLVTAVRLAVEYRCRGAVTPKRQSRAPRTTGKLKPHIAFLVEIVRRKPDITLKELAGALQEAHGVLVQLSSIHRAPIPAGRHIKRCGRTGAREY
jgi:transposase